MSWFGAHPTAMWLVAAMILLVLELFSLDLIFAMLGVAALAGALASAVGAPAVVSVPVACGSALGLLAFLRPPVRRRLHAGPELRTGVAALIGAPALALTDLDPHRPGRVKIGGDEWTALPYGGLAGIPQGAQVEVIDIKGATAYVLPTEGHF